MDHYEAWSREIDQRTTPGQPGMIRFNVYAVEGADKGEPLVQVVEDIEVSDFDEWIETCTKPGMAYVQGTIAERIDESMLKIVWGKRIVSDLPAGSRPPMPQA